MSPGGAAFRRPRDNAAVVCHSPQPASLVRLVCFPHAGGGPLTFGGWASRLTPDVELWGVTLPGRGARLYEPFARDWRTVVDELVDAVLEHVEPPVALFGHSLGALVAFEVARTLTRAACSPSHLVVSGRNPPDATRPTGTVPASDSELLRHVDERYGAIPDEVRRSPELLAHFVPILRADLELARSYAMGPGPVLTCPVTAIAGNADPTVSLEHLARWGRQTTGGCEVHELAAGHFYPAAQERTVLETIRRRVAA